MEKKNIIDIVKSGDIEAIRALDPAEVDIDAVSDDGWGFTALGWACWHAEIDIANLLLDRFSPNVDGCHVYSDGHTVATPLHLACEVNRGRRSIPGCEERQIPLVERLIAAGADIHHRDITGNTAYSRALGHHYKIADILEKHGAGPEDHGQYDRCIGPIESMLEYLPDPNDIRELLRRGAHLSRPVLAAQMIDTMEADAREFAQSDDELSEELAIIAEIRDILADELKRPDPYHEEELRMQAKKKKHYEMGNLKIAKKQILKCRSLRNFRPYYNLGRSRLTRMNRLHIQLSWHSPFHNPYGRINDRSSLHLSRGSSKNE